LPTFNALQVSWIVQGRQGDVVPNCRDNILVDQRRLCKLLSTVHHAVANREQVHVVSGACLGISNAPVSHGVNIVCDGHGYKSLAWF
jgi:hypothetical protein